jgi:hypothetical protein
LALFVCLLPSAYCFLPTVIGAGAEAVSVSAVTEDERDSNGAMPLQKSAAACFKPAFEI